MKQIQKTIRLEGGYVFDEDDPGGETKYGISKRTYPDLDIKNLTPEMAEEIYKRDFWDKLGLDAYTNPRYQWKVFDISINMGRVTASGFSAQVIKKDTVDGVWELVEMQVKRYVNICKSNPKMLKYISGWINRAFDTGEDL